VAQSKTPQQPSGSRMSTPPSSARREGPTETSRPSLPLSLGLCRWPALHVSTRRRSRGAGPHACCAWRDCVSQRGCCGSRRRCGSRHRCGATTPMWYRCFGCRGYGRPTRKRRLASWCGWEGKQRRERTGVGEGRIQRELAVGLTGGDDNTRCAKDTTQGGSGHIYCSLRRHTAQEITLVLRATRCPCVPSPLVAFQYPLHTLPYTPSTPGVSGQAGKTLQFSLIGHAAAAHNSSALQQPPFTDTRKSSFRNTLFGTSPPFMAAAQDDHQRE